MKKGSFLEPFLKPPIRADMVFFVSWRPVAPRVLPESLGTSFWMLLGLILAPWTAAFVVSGTDVGLFF